MREPGLGFEAPLGARREPPLRRDASPSPIERSTVHTKHMSAPIHSRLKDLARAVGEGRLALSEVAAVSPDELDAIYETAVMRIDTGRNADAARMLAGLVVLYPFAHEYWRAYSVALKNLGELVAARRAQEMVRALEPDPSEELVRELLGETGAAEPTNPGIQAPAEVTAVKIVLGPDTRADSSAGEITEPRINMPPIPVPLGGDASTTLSLHGRPEPTVTITAAAGPAPEPTERFVWPIEEEPTALTKRPGVPTTPKLMRKDRSITALVDRRPRPMESGGDTARVDRRFRRRVVTGPAPINDNFTAIVRRRKGLPLGEDV